MSDDMEDIAVSVFLALAQAYVMTFATFATGHLLIALAGLVWTGYMAGEIDYRTLWRRGEFLFDRLLYHFANSIPPTPSYLPRHI